MPDAKPTLSEASHEVQVNESRFVLGFPLLLLLLFFLRLLLGVLTMLLSLTLPWASSSGPSRAVVGCCCSILSVTGGFEESALDLLGVRREENLFRLRQV